MGYGQGWRPLVVWETFIVRVRRRLDTSRPSLEQFLARSRGRLLALGAVAVAIAGAATLLQDRGLPVSTARASTPTGGGSRGAGVVGIVGVLRRPQTSSDLDRRVLEEISLASGSRARAWWGTPVRSLIRLATVTPWGDKVFLVAFRPPSRASSSACWPGWGFRRH
jgi:hypothetical protein